MPTWPSAPLRRCPPPRHGHRPRHPWRPERAARRESPSLEPASEGVADKPERGDQFGWTLAHGDFDADGFSDLAISARWEGPEGRDAGAVHVLYGSPDGLSTTRARIWHQASPGIPGRPGHEDEFGWVMVAGDFDGDGHDDLAIDTHREDFGAHDAGAVHVLYGGPAGLTAARAQAWHQGSPGVADHPETGDGFGKALAAGDFNRDGIVDLAIGAPYESRGTGATTLHATSWT
ncbi:hypothetical protein BH23CHL8_BH23CHL8_07460 [soil metagenome]